jgi:hypothetical protein
LNASSAASSLPTPIVRTETRTDHTRVGHPRAAYRHDHDSCGFCFTVSVLRPG